MVIRGSPADALTLPRAVDSSVCALPPPPPPPPGPPPGFESPAARRDELMKAL